MGSLGPWEIIGILLILLLLFGAKRLPELARGLGKSLREFKKATRDIQDEIEDVGKLDKKIESQKSDVKDSEEIKVEDKSKSG